ncbi:Retrovirus-related Pol polyprotein from transposon TNT 1-94 [Araneus ventricosus]|uniref:Retrovirus-related Pol polyprotein from transposon TNT 1-94 n=1 Tax=Araneus ventricosus TaxID=182803 RepID=A0A4Y2KS10_ARAVE|nr:Retrovirus-related Pol polyprotein from transposon TNT 1-94 [Araneus ventricosus]
MNGVAERFNLIALDGVKALLKYSGMSQKFWAEALLCFTYAWNRVCHKNKKTLFELYSGKKPSVSHLKKFGCVAYVGVPKQTRRKLDMRAKLGIMCGYAQTTKGYRILLLEDQRVIETINVSGNNTESGKVTDLLNLNEANLLEVRIPRTYKEAIKVPEASKWEDAMNQELKVRYERNVWELVKPPKDAKTLGNRWVYALKRNEQNEIVTYKAHLVAQGFNQIKEESYNEVFSPVVNFSIIRLFFTVFVCLFKWLNVQIDINNAHLYANLDEVIYMSQPEGIVVEADKVCRLKRAIYGLHQSGRQWFLEMDNILKELNFLKLEWCNCVYMYKNKLILLLYVDGVILFAKNRKDLELGIDLLKRHFELKVLGKTKKLLGIEFMEVDGKLFIHQNSYFDKVCNLYSKFKFPISLLPIHKGQVLSKLDSPCTKQEVEEMSNLP